MSPLLAVELVSSFPPSSQRRKKESHEQRINKRNFGTFEPAPGREVSVLFTVGGMSQKRSISDKLVTPDEAWLRECVLDIKKRSPDFGVKRVWMALREDRCGTFYSSPSMCCSLMCACHPSLHPLCLYVCVCVCVPNVCLCVCVCNHCTHTALLPRAPLSGVFTEHIFIYTYVRTHLYSGFDISQQRVGKVLRQLGLIRHTPSQALPPTPAAAAAALFLCTYTRLSFDSLISLLDAGLLADILDCYACAYAELDFAEQSEIPWTCAFVETSVQVATSSHQLSHLQPGAEAHGASLESRRRARSRVLHLPAAGPAWSATQSVSSCESGGGRGRGRGERAATVSKDGANRAGEFKRTSTTNHVKGAAEESAMQERLRLVRLQIATQAAAVDDNSDKENTGTARVSGRNGEEVAGWTEYREEVGEVHRVSASERAVTIQRRRREMQEAQCGEGAWARTWLGGDLT